MPDAALVPPEAATSRYPAWRARLACRLPGIDAVFDEAVDRAQQRLSRAGIEAWLDFASGLGRLGRGSAPVLSALAVWPVVAARAGEDALGPVCEVIAALQKSPDNRAITLFLDSLPGVAVHLQSADALARYGALVLDLAQRTRVSIHGHHATEPSPGLPVFLAHAQQYVAMVPLDGLARWIDAGVRWHGAHPPRQAAYFALQSPESRALLQRERPGTLLCDVAQALSLMLRALWQQEAALVAYPVGESESDGVATPWRPHLEADGFRLPEVLQDLALGRHGVAVQVTARQRYRAMAAHLAAHRVWSQPLIADNWSPLQRMAVECLEDARVDHLLLQRFPGWRPVLLALHPQPVAGSLDLTRRNGLRHRLACLSRALLARSTAAAVGALPLPVASSCGDTAERDTCAAFAHALQSGSSSTQAMAELALDWVARTRVASDQFADVAFEDTTVDWRDDNRHLWTFIEAGDEEEAFDRARAAPAVETTDLPPLLYPEWDEGAAQLRPDWVSVHERLQPSGDAADIDALMRQHADTARHLKRLLDALKPQDRQRLRRQEEGSDLDLEAALRSLIDARASGQAPDPRVLMSHQPKGRSLAVTLLLDLSASVNDVVSDAGASGDTVLGLSRAAVALLAQAVQALGDQLAIVGFQSNTRHAVRMLHIKGFGEDWTDAAPQARLAGTCGAWSTRLGAAVRHAGRALSGRQADKHLLLVLTDGQPADVDVSDPHYLIADAAHAVRTLAAQGVHTHCVSLDPKADAYVARIFGARVSVIDRVDQLPQRLPEVFLALTS